MGERLLCKQEVIGSIPFTSTTGEAKLRRATSVAPATLKATRLGEEQATRGGAIRGGDVD